LDPDVPSQPSVVVKQRLAARYHRSPADLDVRILRTGLRPGDGSRRLVEVLAMVTPPDSDLADAAERERAEQHEAHVAFEVEDPDPLVLHGLRALLTRHGALAEGGGYNQHEDGTVFYFTAPDSKARYRRVELYARGDHSDVLARHLADHRARQPAEKLLRLMTGAWTTQALTACSDLGIPDAMDLGRVTSVNALARAVGADPQNLATLLRYLAMLGVVVQTPTGFRLTETGALLRDREPSSMRALALMYGGPFYQSFAGLAETVRTGREAFERLYGQSHFDYFAARPELTDLFDRSMAASSPMFEPVPVHPVFAAAEVGLVVDVAGGTGDLLGRVLAAHPRLRGVLLERPHVVDAARTALDAAGLGERCTCVVGDFADVPAGGDVYILSRVLHDWDDERCREILGHCVRAMPDGAVLLVVERVLPADGAPSLATAWDLHMMCNVGGRERSLDHYSRLFREVGLDLVDVSALPLDGSVLHVRKAH
jgi:hypothetical protein